MKNNQINIQNIIKNGKLIRKLNKNSKKVNSEAYFYSLLGKEYIIRKIGKQYNISLKQLVVLENNINIYYKLLKKNLGIGIPSIFFTEIDKKQNIILLATNYFSKGDILNNQSYHKRIKYFKIISRTIIRLTNNKKNNYMNKLICSIDVNPNNFLLDYNNSVIYNDFTPPFYREKGKWLEFRRIDETHAKKTDKEKRYFIGLNLLLAFINKTRLYLSFSQYLKFIEWLSDEVSNLNLSSKNSVCFYPEIYKEILNDKLLDFHKYEKYTTKRDILRFILTFRSDLTSLQIKKIYEKSKKTEGINILIKVLNGKNKNSYNWSR